MQGINASKGSLRMFGKNEATRASTCWVPMSPEQLCRSMLRLVDSIPTDVPWGVSEIADANLVFVHDSREESTCMIMEAVAERFGDIVAIESIPSLRRDQGPLLGCLVNCEDCADESAGRLRAAYWQATEPGSDGENQPF